MPYQAVHAELRDLAARLQPLFMELPPDTRAHGLRGLAEAARLGRHLRGLRGRDIEGLTQLLTGSLGQFIDTRFESRQAKALLLANNLYGKHGGPYQPGTLIGLAFHLLTGGEDAVPGFFGHVMGGMGAISEAIAAAGPGARPGDPHRGAGGPDRGHRRPGVRGRAGRRHRTGSGHGAVRRRPQADVPAPGGQG